MEKPETGLASYAPSAMTGDTKLEESGQNSTNDSAAQSLKDIQPENAAEDTIEYPGGAKLAFIVMALALSIFLMSLDMTIVATAIPKITDEFQGLDLVGWYGSAFFLTLASFQSTWGKAYKYFPLKITFLVAIFVFELGSLICAVSPNSTALIVGRAIAGVGGAGIGSGAYTIIAFAVKPDLRPAFTGILGASYGIASVVGPLLGGVFADKTTWRWCFYINLPIGGISAAVIFFFFKTPPAAVPVKASFKEKLLQMDLLGTFVVVAAVVCYLLALQWGGVTKSWSDGSVIGTLVAFGVLSVVFIVIEYFLGERAMIVGRLAKERTIYISMAFIFFLAGAFFLLLYYLPIYFQVVSGVSPSDSGVRNLPLIIGTTIGTIVSGGLITMYGHFVPVLIAAACGTTIGAGLIFTLDIGSPSSQWIGYQALAGLSIGFGLQVPIISGQGISAPSDLSSVTAMILFFQTIGGAFFVTAGQSAFENILLKRLPITAPGIEPATILAAGTTQIRTLFPAETIPGIIEAYMDGLHASYAIAIAAAGIATILSFGSKWRNLKGVDISGAA